MELYFGENTFDSYITSKQRIREISKQKDLEILVIEGDEIQEFEEIRRTVQDQGLFGTSNAVLLKRPHITSKIWEELSKENVLLNSENLIIWVDSKLAKNKKSNKTILAAASKHQEFPMQKDYELGKWVMKTCRLMKLQIDSKSSEVLASRCNYNEWIIANQLKKLKSIGYTKIDKELVEQYVPDNSTGNIFNIIELLHAGDKQKLLQELNKFLDSPAAVHQLIGMLTKELNMLLKAINKIPLKAHSYVQQKITRASNKYSPEKLEKLILGLMKLDTTIKNDEGIEPITQLKIYLIHEW